MNNSSDPQGTAHEAQADRSATIHHVILEQMDDGVIVVGFGGVVATLNTAGAHILGTNAEDVVGRPFAERLVLMPGLDSFTELVLDAVTNERTSERQTVAINRNGEERLLSVSTSYLRDSGESNTDANGIIAVFSDITATEALRESELQLGRQVREQYQELQDAYRSVEENNETLETVLRRVRVIQSVAVVAVLAVFLLAGVFVWNAGATANERPEVTHAAPIDAGVASSTMSVMPERLLTTVAVTGELTPREAVGVLSPANATVRGVFVRYGDEVTKGQDLVALDMSRVQQEYRSQRAEYIQAELRLTELEQWEEGPTVSNARRALSRASNELDKQRRKLEETAFLLERGVIPAGEHEAAQDQYENLQVEHEIATQALQAARAQGGAQAQEIAKLGFENLRDRLRELERMIEADVLRAPVAGIVLRPQLAEAAGNSAPVIGMTVAPGDLIVAVADITALSVDATVDELDVTDIRVGQSATVTSDAAPDIALRGVVTNVSSQALPDRLGPQARFAVTVAIDTLDDYQRRRLKLGMSVDARIVTRDRADALLVPLAAVILDGERATIRVHDDATDEARVVEVATGTTTVDRVEITRGLAAGDKIYVPDGV